MPMYQKHPTRTTKRGGADSPPDDVFKVEAEVSMMDLEEKPTMDGRNPHIATGSDRPPMKAQERP